MALVRVYCCRGGFRLLSVATWKSESACARSSIERFGYSLLFIGVLAALGSWFIARRVLKRVDDMTEITRDIMAGDLGGRLKIAGTGDELDRLAQNLNAMLDRIGELMRGMHEVSDNIAHDLKTPLTRLRNKADEALRTAKTPDELKAALEATIEESDNLIRIFNALLMIARLEAGNAREGLADFDAAEAVRDVAELYEALAEEAASPLSLHRERPAGAWQPRTPGSGHGQSSRQRAEIRGRHGWPRAYDRGRGQAGWRRGSDLCCRPGPGIPEEERSHVLERFVRLETARSRPGFGLASAWRRPWLRLHGGHLVLEDNEPGLRVVSGPASQGSGGSTYYPAIGGLSRKSEQAQAQFSVASRARP